MATKTFSGYLKEPLSEYAQHDLWRFTHATTTGEVVKGSTSIFKVDETGYYDIEIQYGTVMIESKDRLSQRWINHGQYTISSTTTVTTLPALLLATTPMTPELQQELELILASAEEAASSANESKDLAKSSENISKQNADKTSEDRAGVESLAQTVSDQAQQVNLNAQQVSQDKQIVTNLANQVQVNKNSVDQSVIAVQDLTQSASDAATIANEKAVEATQAAAESALRVKGVFIPGQTNALQNDTWIYEESFWYALVNTSSTPSISNGDWTSLSKHNSTTNRDEQGAHPASAIDGVREMRNELVGGVVFPFEPEKELQVGDVLADSVTHIRLAGEIFELVSPSAGVVDSVSEDSITVGGGVSRLVSVYERHREMSIADFLSKSDYQRLMNDDETLDLSDLIQFLIDKQQKFNLVPNVRHYCDKHLVWKSGAKCSGGGQGTNQQYPAPVGITQIETAIVFDSHKTSTGIVLARQGWTTEFELSGFTIDCKDPHHGRQTFKPLHVESNASGAFGGKVHLYIRNFNVGLHTEKPLWNTDVDIRFGWGYRPALLNGGGTSLTGWLKSSFCFHGVSINEYTYSNINQWYDQCGLSAPIEIVNLAPATELPIMLEMSSSVAISGIIGVEKCKAQLMRALDYTFCDFSLNYQEFGAEHIFYKDPERVSIPINHQGLFHLRNSCVTIRSTKINLKTGLYPPAPTVDPTFLCTFEGFDVRFSAFNSYIDARTYGLCPNGAINAMNVSEENNVAVYVGAQNITKPPLAVDVGMIANWDKARLKFGSAPFTEEPYHRIERNNLSFVDNDKFLSLSGALYADTLDFYTSNSGKNATPAAVVKMAKNATTDRSISVMGTINTQGADYAEYMRKSTNCGLIEKGAVCGIDKNGLLTDKFDESVKFVVKSTSPSFVGGDTFSLDIKEVVKLNDEDDESFLRRVKEAEEAVEERRQMYDRIAFCGQVPCSAMFEAGDYLIPKRNEDGSIGIYTVKDPTITEFRLKVGQAISNTLIIVSV